MAPNGDYARGLLSQLVAERCQYLGDAPDREIAWFIQWRSHLPGGLPRLATELIERNPQRLGTPAMRRIGMKPGRVYTSEEMGHIALELGGACRRINSEKLAADLHWSRSRLENGDTEAAFSPRPQFSYSPRSIESFFCIKDVAAVELPAWLEGLCLNSDAPIRCRGPWYLRELYVALAEYRDAISQSVLSQSKTAGVGSRIYETLDYSLETKSLVLISGQPRSGRSHAARAWCESKAGMARYVKCPARVFQ